MPNKSDKKSLLIMASVFTFIVFTTLAISFFASGYQISFQQGPVLKATGLLSATSRPKSAPVYINDQLVTATDDTINLPPGSYSVKIVKDGYLPWQKNVTIKREVVYLTDTNLFRSVPEIKPITLSGSINPSVSEDKTKIVYAVSTASDSKDNGLYLLEIADNPLSLSRNPIRLLYPNSPTLDWSKFTFEISPNSRQLIASSSASKTAYLLPLDTPITTKNLFDVSGQLNLIKKDWQTQTEQIISSRLLRLPQQLKSMVATESANHLLYSPSDNKILYLANNDGNLDQILVTPPLSQSDQPQTRHIQKGNYYVYDLKEDTNFLIGSSQTVIDPFWLPDSNNLVFVENNTIKGIDADSTNLQTLYAGNFNPQIVLPWTDGNRIITLTSAYTGSPENLYSISIR
jgi:hypothetical protein